MMKSFIYCCRKRKTFRNWWPKMGRKNISTNPFWTKRRLSLLGYYRRQLPSLAHQKTTRLSPEILISTWRWSDLNRMRCIILRRSKTWSWGMARLPLWCNSKIGAKRRNLWISNSGPCHQRRKGSLFLSFSVYFTCTIFLIIPYPRTWDLPQN